MGPCGVFRKRYGFTFFFTVIPLKSLCAQIICYLTSCIQYSLCFLYFGKQGFSEKGNPETKPGGMVQ